MVASMHELDKSDIMLPNEKDVLIEVCAIIEARLLHEWDRQARFAITRAGMVQDRR
jgi:hypothetical protein